MVDNVNIINLNFDRSNLPNGFTGLAIYPNRLKEWYVNGQRHREDGPVSIDTDGTIESYLNGSPIFYLFLTLDYIVISEGVPCDIKWMGRPVKAYKALTTRGIEFMPDLPGMRDILFSRQ